MIKLFAILLTLSSFSTFAQEDTVSITEETLTPAVETPVEVPAESPVVETPVAESTEENKVTEEVAEQVVAPAPVATPVATSAPGLRTETEMDKDPIFKSRKSHWISTFGFESSKYEVVPKDCSDCQFSGRKNFKNGDTELWGGRIGFGGELYLGWGFITRSMVEGFYHGTLFSQILNGGDEAADVEFAYTKKTSQLVGGDLSQSFGWMFDFKTKNPFMDEWSYLTFETFVEAGIGKAWGYNRINYSYDTGTAPTAARESYRLKMRDDLLNARVGGGFILTSKQGFFLNLKATINRFEITQRKLQGFTQENGQASTPISDTQKNASMDPVVIYTLGGGYKF